MRHSRLAVGFFSVCALAALAGCGSSDGRYAISGEVKWRGKPLDHGAITFLAENPESGAGTGAQIKDGRYSIPVASGLPPGRYKVIINSAEPGPSVDPDALPGPSGPLPKDRIKPKYNAQTTLTAEVKAGSSNTFNFEVD